ncbi:MAG TPA: SRPBCC domain-containing protein [Chitinophagaceae bacterium]|nr:SRPBCC domain-containing protein [Chitinophagaceae bacterium]
METTKTKSNVKRQGAAVQNELVIHRVFNLPVSKVWRALTEPEEFKKWWGPKGFTCPFSKMEARVGGKYLSCMRGPDGKEFWSTGVVKEFIPEKKLVVTDSFSDSEGNKIPASDYGMPGNWPEELLITFELEEADGATKFRLQHEGIPEEMHDECIKGWNESFDKLEENIS